MELLRHFRYSPFPIETRFDVIDKKDAPLCAVKLEVRFGTNIIPNKELQKTIMNRQKFVMLQDETMGVLPDDWLEDYGLIIKHLIFEAEHIWLNKFLLIFSNQSKHAQLFQNLDLGIDIAQWKDKWAQYQNNPTTQIAIENYVNADLRPYQAKGVEWMVLISEVFSGALLSDDMGLGKTIQTITFLGYMNLKHPGKHLIIAPAGLMYNWKKELENFGIGLSSYVYHRQDRNISSQEFHEAKAIITSYQTARADIDNLAMIQWNTIVLDESHYIKNPAAQTTKAILQLQAKMKILLSGTPVMNSTMDLYPQYEFIMPNFFANESFFRKEYADPIDIHRDENKIKQLQKISSFINLRRTKEKVLDELPEKTESILYCDMGETQRKLYDLIKKSIKEKVIMDIKEKGIGASKLGVLEAIQKLRIVCSDPSNIQEFSIQTQESIKIDLLMDQIRDILHQSKQHGLSNLELAHNVAVKNKIIVFSQFLNTLSVIKKRLEDDKIPYYFFDGSVAQEKRQELVNKFQDDSNRVPVFVISLKSGNMGITLTKANYVFLIDPWWNKFIEQQAIDRVYRIGQKEKVFAYRLICRDTIEERIIQLQERKLKLQEDLIQEDEGFIKNLSVDDIDFLFA
jgi:SNF2 family DNA or RNA helicase